LETLSIMRKHDQIDRKRADRLRAVALTASALGLEDSDTDKALQQSVEAHELAPDLVTAAVVAGRIHASRGNTGKAVAILQRAWKKTQHPDLVTIYAYVKPGEVATERLKRVRELAQLTPSGSEGAIAIAGAALEARDFEAARRALEPISGSALTARVCLLMAKIEGAERGDAGRVREWLSRSARAPRDPAWVAGDHVADHWMPVSPVSGEFDVYRWKVPDAALSVQNGAALLDGLLPSLAERHAPGLQVEGSVGEIVEAGARKESEDVANGAMAAAMAAMFAGAGSNSPAQKGSENDDPISDGVGTSRAIRPGKVTGQGHADLHGNVTAFERGTASSYAEQSQASEGRLAGRAYVGDGLSDDSEAAEPAAPEVKASAWTGMGSFKRIVGGVHAASTAQSRRADREATDVIVVPPPDERGVAAEPAASDPVTQQRRDPAA
jgi:uncharacterized membrane-anchored protein